MVDLNLLEVLVAAIGAVVLSTVWYIALGGSYSAALQEFRSADEIVEEASPPPWKVGVEFVRSLVVVTAVAVLATRLDLAGLTDGLLLGLALWFAFPLVLLAGSVIWDGVPLRLAMIHAGDWALKLLLIAAITSLWI